MVKVSVILCSSLLAVQAHVGLIRPTTWMNPVDASDHAPKGQYAGHKHYCYVNDTFVPKRINDDAKYWSVGMHDQKTVEPEKYPWAAHRPHGQLTPWESPGRAPVSSPCGHYGGNAKGCCPFNLVNPDGKTCAWGQPKCAYGGTHMGEDCRTKDFPSKDVFTEWQANSKVQAGWGIMQNHGGGYAYRLCKMKDGDRSSVTEECMQAGHLKFGARQWVKKADGPIVEIPPDEVIPVMTKGTWPENSEWRLNPIAPCGGMYATDSKTCQPGTLDKQGNKVGPKPPSVAKDMFGYGVTKASWSGEQHTAMLNYMVLDEIQVPDWEPGEYVLSFRFDAEQNPQVWLNCASIRIVAENHCSREACAAAAQAEGAPMSREGWHGKRWPYGCFKTGNGRYWWNDRVGDEFDGNSAKANMVCPQSPIAGTALSQNFSQNFATKMSRQVTMSVDDAGLVEQM